MKKAQLEEKLGPPASADSIKSAKWEKRHDEVNFERASVNFEKSSRVKDVEWESSRGNNQGIYHWQKTLVRKADEAHPRWLNTINWKWAVLSD